MILTVYFDCDLCPIFRDTMTFIWIRSNGDIRFYTERHCGQIL